jgi:hypothetical protein
MISKILTVVDEGMEPVGAHVHEQVHREEHGEGRAGLRRAWNSRIVFSHDKQPKVMCSAFKNQQNHDCVQKRTMILFSNDNQMNLADEDGASLRRWSRQAPARLSVAKKVFFHPAYHRGRPS